MKTKKTTGFTVIELLVVMALIALLSSLILVSLKNVRNKAKDARIQTDLYQLRTIAEIFYQNNNTYKNFDLAPPNSGYNPDYTTTLKVISDDINITQGLPARLYLYININGKGYCAFSSLIGSAGKFWCADSKLNLKQYNDIPSLCSSGCVAADTCACQ